MDFAYIVIENGDPYPFLYRTYNEATEAVREKYNHEIEADLLLKDDYSVNVLYTPENPTGISLMYVEKGIHIEIYKLPIKL